MDISHGKSLFPSAYAVKEESESRLEREPDWLTNQSFPRNSAQVLIQHQPEREDLLQSQTITTFPPDPQQEEAAVPGEQNKRREDIPSSHIVHVGKNDRDSVHVFKHSLRPCQSEGRGSDLSLDEKDFLDEGHILLSAVTEKSERGKSNVSCDHAASFLKDEQKETVRERSSQGSEVRRSEKRHSGHSRHSRKKKKKRHHHDSESSTESEGRRYKKKKSQHKKRRHRHAEERDRLRKRPTSMWIDDIGSIPATPFYLDEKSDKNNLCFNSLNFTDVAFYRRLGKSCMGLDPATQSVDWEDGKSNKSSKKSVKDTGRYFIKSFSEVDVERIPVPEKKCHKVEGEKEQADYVEMPYISLASSKSSDSSKSPDEQHQLDNENRSGLISSDASQKIAFFNKHLHEHPNDIAKWLDFVHFQDQVGVDVHAGTPGNEGVTVGSSRRQQLILEKKLAILEKALKANPGNPDLQLEQLELCRENWDTARLTKHWQSTIRQHRENLEMWQQYLAYQRSCFAKFSVSRISKLYEDFLSALNARGTEFKFDVVLQVCHFWRQTGYSEKAVALFQAMVEFNCFRPQNIEESTTLDGKIAFFEPFWDSNEARFGEAGAEGWSKWVHRKEKGGWASQNPQNTQRFEEDESAVEGTEPTWHAWLQEEILREHAHFSPWLPGGGQTEDDCEDPDRMVLFDDISCFLCDLDTQEQKFVLILAFLDFLGAYRHGDMSLSETAFNTLEHPWEVFEYRQKLRRNDGTCGVLLNGKLILPLQKTSHQQVAPDGCRHVFRFADTIIEQAIPLFPEDAQRHLRLIQMQYNLKSVEPSVSAKKHKKQVKEGQKLAKCILGQESNRINLRLWEEFARWEWSNGSEAEAQRIFETALTFSDTNLSPNGSSLDVCRLLSVYVSLKMGLQVSHRQPSVSEITTGRKPLDGTLGCTDSKSNQTEYTSQLARKRQEALHHLTTLGEGGNFATLSEKNVSAARILKARKGYVDLFMRLVESYKNSMQTEQMHGCRDAGAFKCLDQQGSNFVHFSLCYALFQYLSVSMQACGVVFEETLTTFEGLLSQVRDCVDDGDRTIVQQQLELDMDLMWTFYVRVASYHVNSHPMPVALLRNILQRALKRNSNNPELLGTLIALEERSHIAGRLRRYFDRATSETTHPMPWLFAIQAELRRLQKIQGDQDSGGAGRERGITHRVRSLFDKATSNRHTRCCVLLWRLYLHFEVQQGDKQRGKSIFYRAVQHCPWSKSLYMDAVRYYPEELQAVLDLLLEKEIRVRAPLEEVQLLMRMAQSKLKKE